MNTTFLWKSNENPYLKQIDERPISDANYLI